MSKVILVTGGARSGKSNFAEKLCKDQNNNTAYIATSIPFDDEMKERVKKHKESRPQNWKTYEIYKDIYTIINDISKEHKTVILDCVTLLVNNLMFTYEIDIDNSTQDEINGLEKYIKEARPKITEDTENALFVNSLGQRFTRQGLWKLIKKYASIANINKNINPSMLRHSFAIHLLNEGANIAVVSKILGNANLSSLQAYLNHINKNMRREIKEKHPRK